MGPITIFFESPNEFWAKLLETYVARHHPGLAFHFLKSEPGKYYYTVESPNPLAYYALGLTVGLIYRNMEREGVKHNAHKN